jgi:hypothetical protein
VQVNEALAVKEGEQHLFENPILARRPIKLHGRPPGKK